MKVAVVSPEAAGGAGGIERFCRDLARAVASVTDWTVDVVDVNSGSRGWAGVDCLVTNGMMNVGHARIPRVHVFHGCWPVHMRFDHRRASRAWRLRFAVSGSLREYRAGLGATRVSVSESAAREVRRWYGLGSTVVPNAVDTTIFGAVSRQAARHRLGVDQHRRLALFPGRAEDRKRPDLAVEACREAGFELLHAGSRPMQGACELGALTAPELALWYAAADVVLAPSDYEAASLAVLESLACGTPVVGTRVGWLRELENEVPEYGALLADRGDLDQLVAGLMSLERSVVAVANATMRVRRHHDLASFGRAYAGVIGRAVA